MQQKPRRSRRSEACTIIRILTMVSVLTGILNITVLTICLCAGRWIFGDLMCQIFAFVSHVMVGGSAWLIALAGLERYFKLLLPADHACVFSEINTKILVVGVYLLVAVVLTNPLYGWGEFSEYRGYFHFTVLISKSQQVPDMKEVAYNSTNTTDTASCQVDRAYKYTVPEDMNVTELMDVIKNSFKTNWNFKTRLLDIGQGNLTYVLRASSDKGLQKFMQGFSEGTLGKDIMSHGFTNCDCSRNGQFLCSAFYLDFTEIADYRHTYMSFQAPAMCSLDFTTLNKSWKAWMVFFVLSTAIGPYGMTFVIFATIMCRWQKISLDLTREDSVRTQRIFIGSLLSLVLYTPYFIMNFMNACGSYFSLPLNVLILIVFYLSALGPSILCCNRRCPRNGSRPPSPTERRSDTDEDIEFELLQMCDG